MCTYSRGASRQSGVFLAVLAATMIVAGNLPAQTAAGYPQDWSHRHLVFSNPGTYEQAMQKGTGTQWMKITNSARYKIQQSARAAASVAAFAPTATSSALGRTIIKKDWSTSLVGSSAVAASLTGVIGTLSSGTIASTSTLAVDGVTLDASPPTAATATGTFTGNPANGQTVTIGGSEVLAASLSTAATGKITVASGFCMAQGQGVTISGTSLTTNATAGTGTFVVGTVPSSGESVTIGGVTYTFETSTNFTGTTPANQVLVPGSNSSGNRTITAENLSVAINNSGTCGSTSGGVCTRNVSAANPELSSTDSSSATQTMTALCADNAAITGTSSTHVTVNNVAAGGAGSNTSTTFALSTSNTTTATNIATAVVTNATTSGIVTALAASGVVTLTAKTWGSAANSYTLSDTATSGVTLSAFSGGVDGTNTGGSFAVDNANADNATNLAAAITRNGGTVGVTATSAGAVVTVTASTLGTGGNSIAITEGLNNFGWTGSATTLGGATDGTTSGTTTPPTFAYWSVNNYVSQSQLASNIATAINNNTTLKTVSTGVSATTSGNGVIITARTVGTGGNSRAVTPSSNFTAFTPGGDLSGGTSSPTGTVQPNAYPAKFSFSTTTATCTDFIVYPIGTEGATAAASIVAYDNLYTTGCLGTPPSVYWAYNTGGTVTTSPILSLDGSQVAFVQVTGTAASLVLLKWKASTGESVSAPATLVTQAASGYSGCTAPCMLVLPFSGGHNDTYSSPFYDYASDTLYVGDDSGNLHKFTAVFDGTPAESTSPWPVNLGTNKLSSPVFDATWNGGQTIVGDLGGVLHCVYVSGAPCANNGSAGSTATPVSGGQIADAPLIDSSANYLIAFVNSSTANGVYGYGEQYFPNTPGSVSVGTGASGYYLYDGTYDNVYYQSSNHTGNLYVVANTGATTGATLYRLGVSGGFLTGGVTGVVTGLTGSGAHPWPSPVSEFCNPGSAAACALNAGGTATTTGIDYVFFSVNQGNVGSCNSGAGHGCVLSYNVSNPSAVAVSGTGLGVTTPGTNGCWATGGLVIDNGVPSSAFAGASQIYFVNLNGSAAGNPAGATSSNCTTGSAANAGVQAAQANP